jgi:VTC domain
MQRSIFHQLLTDALEGFAPAAASLQEQRGLLQRSDAKFLSAPASVPELIAQLPRDYAVLPVAGGAIATYENLYFDFPDLRCYHDHRRGRRIRHKIRIRHYPDRGLAYLEIKNRRNNLITDKRRIQVEFGTTTLDERSVAFLREWCPDAAALIPTLQIDYRRIGLIGLARNERITIDYALQIKDRSGTPLELGEVAVIEVKQPRMSIGSPIMQALREEGLSSCSFSKYSIATALIGKVPCHRFKSTLRALERIAS